MTDAGADYLARIEPLLSDLEEADHAARGTGELRGVLRIALSSSFGVREVIPRLPDFLERHPALRVDLGINDARQDLVADGVDVALRLGLLRNSALVSSKLAEAPRLLAASPAYLERRGRPRDPADLAAHALIVGPGGAGPDAWTFIKSGRRVSIRVEGRLTAAANEGAVAAATAGLGITATSLWACRAELERGDLVRAMSRIGRWTRSKSTLSSRRPRRLPRRPRLRRLSRAAAAERVTRALSPLAGRPNPP